MRVQALQSAEAQQENMRLRRLLALRERLPLTTMSADVIGREASGWVRAPIVAAIGHAFAPAKSIRRRSMP